MAKEFLSRRDVAFEIVDTSQLDDPVGTLRAITGGPIATPVVVIGEAYRVGFDPEWIAARLDDLPVTKSDA